MVCGFFESSHQVTPSDTLKRLEVRCCISRSQVFSESGFRLALYLTSAALKLLKFLEKLRAGRNSPDAVLKAAHVIVSQFLHDMGEMGIVDDNHF